MELRGSISTDQVETKCKYSYLLELLIKKQYILTIIDRFVKNNLTI